MLRPDGKGVFGQASNEGRMFQGEGCCGQRPCLGMEPREFEELEEGQSEGEYGAGEFREVRWLGEGSRSDSRAGGSVEAKSSGTWFVSVKPGSGCWRRMAWGVGPELTGETR